MIISAMNIRFAAEMIGQSADQDGANKNAGEAGRADDALFGSADVEIAHDQLQRHAGHKDDIAFEKFPGGGERPYPQLHAGHRRRFYRRAAGPGGQFVDVVLHRPRIGRRGSDGVCDIGHSELPQSFQMTTNGRACRSPRPD
jgi:hypothetical protein